MNPNNILENIKFLPLKEALTYLVTHGIVDFSNQSYHKIKKVIQDKQNEGKYAFVPNADEAIRLQKSSLNPSYKEISSIVPRYKHLGLIRTGFLLKQYNEKIRKNIDVDKNKSRVSDIKRQILSRPGGGYLLKIVKFPETEFFSLVLSYLHKLKMHNYPEEHLEEEFMDLVNSWQKSSKFVKNTDNKKTIIDFCKDKIHQEYNRFFLLGLYKNIAKLIEESIDEIKEEFEKNQYEVMINKKESPDFSIIEVLIFKKILD